MLAVTAYVLGRRRTRGPAGVALVATMWALVIGIELSRWTWRILAEGVVVAVVGAVAYYAPGWLLAYRGFARRYHEVDRQVWSEVLQAERAWHAGRIDDAEYSRRFDRAHARYQSLAEPPEEWRDIVAERIRIRNAWSRIFLNASSSTQSERDELGEAEAALRRRIARLTG